VAEAKGRQDPGPARVCPLWPGPGHCCTVSPREADLGRGKDTRLDLLLGPARARREQNSLGEVERREPREQTRDSRPAPASREPWGRGCGAPGG
uniref:Uncharacterized protein n=1 Tax=Theropithecus gelada TaxID=9565 RepID=A0A8D2E7J7_THEGE